MPDKDTYERSLSAIVALQAIDQPLREQYYAQEKVEALDLEVLAHMDKIALAYLGVKDDWPWARIGFTIEQLNATFEGVMQLLNQEQKLRDPKRTWDVLEGATLCYSHSSCGFCPERLCTCKEALEVANQDSLNLFNAEFWYRWLMQEAIAIMDASEESPSKSSVGCLEVSETDKHR